MRQNQGMRSPRNLAIGAGLLAGACWGVSFLAPRALVAIPASTIALLRFLFAAVASILALFFRRRLRPGVDWRTGWIAFGLSLAGYSLYYTLLAVGVKGIGISFATAIIALLPLTILLAATPPAGWLRLGVPILLVAAGGVLVPLELFGPAYTTLLARTPLERALGLGAALGALGLWTAFAVLNARFLKRRPEWNPLDWASVLGVAAGASAIVLSAALEGPGALAEWKSALGDSRVLYWTAFMGIAGAWFASALWNFASRILDPAAAGMLLVFESVFGLAFGFLYERRGPGAREAAAAGCLIAGAILGIRLLKPNGRARSARSGAAG